jgi:RNA polymerase sigma-70 factor (ECF subfamily)
MLTDLQDIIGRIKKGDHAAFRKIVEEYRQQAFSVAFRITCDEEEARDAVQESFIKIWEKLEQYDMNRNFSTWMLRIVVNSAIDRKRQMDRHHLISLDQSLKKFEIPDPDFIEREADNREMASLITWLAQGLPEKQQMVFILRDIQGLESDEVEQILNLSETKVKSNLYHARTTIRERLMRATE